MEEKYDVFDENVASVPLEDLGPPTANPPQTVVVHHYLPPH